MYSLRYVDCRRFLSDFWLFDTPLRQFWYSLRFRIWGNHQVRWLLRKNRCLRSNHHLPTHIPQTKSHFSFRTFLGGIVRTYSDKMIMFFKTGDHWGASRSIQLDQMLNRCCETTFFNIILFQGEVLIMGVVRVTSQTADLLMRLRAAQNRDFVKKLKFFFNINSRKL